MFLPDRYVRGTCPRCKSPDQYGDSCEVCGSTYTPAELIDPLSTLSQRHRCGANPSTCSSSWARSTRCCANTSPAAVCSRRCARSSPNGSQAGLQDWDISRDAPYFGFEIPDAPGKFFYVWFDAPIGYIASFEAWRARTARSFDDYWESKPPPSCITSSARTSATFIRCSGPRCCTARACAGRAAFRAWLPDHQRPEDVQIARHLHYRAALSGTPAARAAALLLCRQAQQRNRGHRLQPRRLRGARQLRPGGQAGEYRQPLRGFHRARRRPACRGSARAVLYRTSLPPASASRRCTSRATTRPRCARSWSWPIAPIATSISTSPGHSPRIPRAPARSAPSPPRA